MFNKAAIGVLITLSLMLIHYAPEPPMTSSEILRHQTARDVLHGVGHPDRLMQVRGRVEQIEIKVDPNNSMNAAIVIDWAGLAAVAAVLGAAYAFVTKLIVVPLIDKRMTEMMEQFDKRYISERTYQLEQEANENILHEHVRTDERFQQGIERQLEQIWQAVRMK